jgi:hypothetical protein
VSADGFDKTPDRLGEIFSFIFKLCIFGFFIVAASLYLKALIGPITAKHIDCLSPTGETFTTDIATNIYKLDYMKYEIREFGGNEIVFEGFCASREKE